MLFTTVSAAVAFATLAFAGDCKPSDPYGQECVNVYSGQNCQAGSQSTSYKVLLILVLP